MQSCANPKPSFMSAFQNLFTSSSITGKLYALRKGTENDDWAEKAIEVAVKKLKRTDGALRSLEWALNNPSAPSDCVPITRSLDGRMQILHRKGHPHVIFCKLWRWPDLKSHHELQGAPECAYSFSKRHQELLCINPYHYVRLVAPALPPIEVASPAPEPLQLLHYPAPGPPSCSSPARAAEATTITPRQYLPDPSELLADAQFARLDLGALDLGLRGDFDYHSPSPQSNSSYGSYGSQGYHSASPSFSPTCEQEYQEMWQYNAWAENSAPVQLNSLPVPYVEQSHWAEIAYYEYNQRVGDKFYCTPQVIGVDGYTDPSNELGRFCLGRLANVHRNEAVQRTRLSIDRGIQLHYVNNQVFLENLMPPDKSVFVQSANGNEEVRAHPNTVVKLTGGQWLKIFDCNSFRQKLDQCAKEGFETAYALTNMCTIRLSFVKGWGHSRYGREDVTGTPCWIEVQLNGPLKWLDNVLKSMGSARFAISSVS